MKKGRPIGKIAMKDLLANCEASVKKLTAAVEPLVHAVSLEQVGAIAA